MDTDLLTMAYIYSSSRAGYCLPLHFWSKSLLHPTHLIPNHHLWKPFMASYILIILFSPTCSSIPSSWNLIPYLQLVLIFRIGLTLCFLTAFCLAPPPHPLPSFFLTLFTFIHVQLTDLSSKLHVTQTLCLHFHSCYFGSRFLLSMSSLKGRIMSH